MSISSDFTVTPAKKLINFFAAGSLELLESELVHFQLDSA